MALIRLQRTRSLQTVPSSIAIFDLEQKDAEAGLPKVAASLADLAGAALDAALEFARAELAASSEFGVFSVEEIDNTGLSIIAMGKCGARELNYISDVDVIFVAESRADSLETDRMLEIATKLATRMMRAIDGTAREPMLWQVDANLRPEGKNGPIVRSFEAYEQYYKRWASTWESQALLRAQPIAGDATLVGDFVELIDRYRYPESLDAAAVTEIRRIKARVETERLPQGADPKRTIQDFTIPHSDDDCRYGIRSYLDYHRRQRAKLHRCHRLCDWCACLGRFP